MHASPQFPFDEMRTTTFLMKNSRFRTRETAVMQNFDCSNYNRYGFAGKEQKCANFVPILFDVGEQM